MRLVSTLLVLCIALVLTLLWWPSAPWWPSAQAPPAQPGTANTPRAGTAPGTAAMPTPDTPARVAIAPADVPAQPQDTTATSTTLRVLLHDADGAPLAGLPFGIAPLEEQVVGGKVRETDFRAGTSDEHGVVDFAATDGGRWRGYPRPASFAVLPGVANEVQIELQRTLWIRGRVVDEADRPIAAAAVVLDLDSSQPRLQREVARSDAAGNFVFEGFGIEAAFVHAQVAGRIPSAQELVRSANTSVPQELTLRIGGTAATLAGTCLDASRRPLAGVRVRVIDAGQGHPPPTGSLTVALATMGPAPSEVGPTSDDGRFTVSGLAPGPARVIAWCPGHAVTMATIDVPQGPGQAFVELSFLTGGAIAGTVLDPFGAPVAKALVYVGEGPAARRDTSGPDGHYRLEHLAAGPHRLSVATREMPKFEREVTVLEGKTTIADLQLARGIEARSRVLTHYGAPVASARVEWLAKSGSGRSTTDTDERGEFSLQGLPDAPCRLQVTPPGQQPKTLFEGASVQALPAVLHLPEPVDATATVHGFVYDHASKPLAGALVLLYAQFDGQSRGSAKTGDDGSFRIQKVEAGNCCVMARLGNLPTLHHVGIEVTNGADLDLGNLVIPEPIECTITLTLPTGVTPDKTWWSAILDEHDVARTCQIQGERVTPPPLGPGRYRVQVSGPGMAAGVQTFELADGAPASVRVEMQSGVEVQFALTFPDGTREPSRLQIVELDANGGELCRAHLIAGRACRGDPVWLRAATRRVRLRAIGATLVAEGEVPSGGGELVLRLRP